jgi:hypothetical protein
LGASIFFVVDIAERRWLRWMHGENPRR